MENKKIEDSIMSIELKYSKDKDNPVKVFDSFKLMFQSIIDSQTELVRKINPTLNVDFLLTDVKSASIWADMTRRTITIEKENGTLLKDETKGDVNEYVNRSTELIIQKMAESKNNPIHSDDVINLTNEINKIAVETKISETPNYKVPNIVLIADALEMATKATKLLSEEDSFEFIRKDKEPISVNKVYTDIDKSKLVSEAKEKIVESEKSMLLKIKIADFLGTTKWKFLTSEGKSIDVKIDDSGWLDNFHNSGKTALVSGDSLNVDGILKETFDKYGTPIDSEYTITKVKGIVHGEN